MLISAILRHALMDPLFKAYRDRWMLEATLTALLNEFYKVPKSLHFNENNLRSAVLCNNQKELVQYGFETRRESNFILKTCGVERSNPHQLNSKNGNNGAVFVRLL